MLEKYFALREHKTDVRTELMAGLTTFMTMAYILAVNPAILSEAGMDAASVFTATALSAIIATLVMAFAANLPVALAPGMGINAFFAFSVVLGMGHSWQFALTAVFLEGLIFIVLTLTDLRDAILESIPLPMKKATTAGIGLFIAFLGLQGGGIVVRNEATMVGIGHLTSPEVLTALLGLALTGALLCLKVRGALLYGILGGTLLGIPFGVTRIEDFQTAQLFHVPSLAPTFWQFEWNNLFSLDMLLVLFIFLFSNIFDTLGTLVGVATKGKLMDEQGRLPRSKAAFMADALGTTAGAIFGTSPVTAYVESASGIAVGGRTGLTALTTGLLFCCALPLAPIFLLVPSQATAPAMIIVGLYMLSPIADINFEDFRDGIPAFLTMLLMPFTANIANGIFFGIISYVVLNACTGHWRKIPVLTWILAVLFVLRIVYE